MITMSNAHSFLTQFMQNDEAAGATTITMKNPSPMAVQQTVNNLVWAIQNGLIAGYELHYKDQHFTLCFELRDPMQGGMDGENGGQLPADTPEKVGL